MQSHCANLPCPVPNAYSVTRYPNEGVNTHRRNAGLPSLDILGRDLATVSPMRSQLYLFSAIGTLLAMLYAAAAEQYVLLLALLPIHFLLLMTFTHDVVHGLAGFTRRQADWVLFLVSLMLLESGHSYRRTHLAHHRHTLEEDDFEGQPARLSLINCLLLGPVYVPKLWLNSFRQCTNPQERGWMIAEALAAMLMICVALTLCSVTPALLIYFTSVWIGSWAFPLMTAYLPHFHADATVLGQARTLRGRFLPRLMLNMPYHLEHHLYPQVPSYHLHQLASRLDPYFDAAGLRPFKVI